MTFETLHMSLAFSLQPLDGVWAFFAFGVAFFACFLDFACGMERLDDGQGTRIVSIPWLEFGLPSPDPQACQSPLFLRQHLLPLRSRYLAEPLQGNRRPYRHRSSQTVRLRLNPQTSVA